MHISIFYNSSGSTLARYYFNPVNYTPATLFTDKQLILGQIYLETLFTIVVPVVVIGQLIYPIWDFIILVLHIHIIHIPILFNLNCR